MLQEKLPQNVQETVHNFKRAIEQQKRKTHFWRRWILAWDYDTNIANDVGRGVTQNLLGLVNLPGNDRRSSAGLSQVLLLNHTYDIGEKGSWAWESNFLAYNKNLTQYSDKTTLFSFATGPSYTIDTYKISFLASHENIRLASEEYLNTSGFAINVKKITLNIISGSGYLQKT